MFVAWSPICYPDCVPQNRGSMAAVRTLGHAHGLEQLDINRIAQFIYLVIGPALKMPSRRFRA
jgi:hypothetical protein